jgi:cell division protein FtsI/penicillin-binding protein 2
MFNPALYLQSVRGRTKWLGLFIGLAFLVFAVRLFYIQVIQHEHYVALAKQTQVTKLTVFAERGTIYARDGATSLTPLVLNETVYTVFADPHEVTDVNKIKEVIQRVAGGEAVTDSFQYLNDTARRYLVLARQVTRTQAELIQKEDLAGVGLQKGSKRVYPEGQTGSQLLGYVNNDGEGQYGLEGALNSRLAGTNGLLQSITDVRRIPLTIGDNNVEQPAKNGDDLVLSVDRNVQFLLEQSLKEHAEKVHSSNASAIIMNPNNGQVVAMANFPTYDPSSFTTVTDYSLFQNRVTDNAYEAGSVMKTLTVSTGIDLKAITPTSTSPNPNGCTTVEDRVICNALRNGVTLPTTQQTLTYSFNTGAVNVVRSLSGSATINKTGRDKLYDYFTNHFRLGKLTGIEQSGEAEGVIYSPEDEEGNNVRYANMSFGQGMTTTMIQMTSAFSTIINGGTYYRPTLIYGTQTANGTVQQQAPTVVAQNVISAESSAQMKEMIWHSRYDNNGKYVDPAGYHIGGKSGTAQTIDPKTGQYTTDKTVGSYIGYVGGSTPQYVIMVRIDDAQGGVYAGSNMANTMYGDVAKWLIAYEGITPN